MKIHSKTSAYAVVLGAVAAAAITPALGRGLCDSRQVITNTVSGAAMTQDIAVANPQYAQMAALVAAVDDTQRAWAKAEALKALRQRGYSNQDIFDLLLMQAERGQVMKQGLNTASGAILGSAAGAVGGALFGKMSEGFVAGGGVGGALAHGGAKQAVSIVLDSNVVQPWFRRVIDNPCEVSSAEALSAIAAR